MEQQIELIPTTQECTVLGQVWSFLFPGQKPKKFRLVIFERGKRKFIGDTPSGYPLTIRIIGELVICKSVEFNTPRNRRILRAVDYQKNVAT